LADYPENLLMQKIFLALLARSRAPLAAAALACLASAAQAQAMHADGADPYASAPDAGAGGGQGGGVRSVPSPRGAGAAAQMATPADGAPDAAQAPPAPQQQDEPSPFAALNGALGASRQPWAAINMPEPSGARDVVLFCSVKSVWCAQLKPQLALWATKNQGVTVRFIPAVAGMDDVPFAKAQIAAQAMGVYSPQFDAALSTGFAKGVDPTNDKQVENWVRSIFPKAVDFSKAYEDPKTDAQARGYAMTMRAFGVHAVPSVAVNGRCLIRPDDVSGPDDYLPRIKEALQRCN
jgi:hypothetical protein